MKLPQTEDGMETKKKINWGELDLGLKRQKLDGEHQEDFGINQWSYEVVIFFFFG